MAIISASLNDFNIKIRNNIELAYTHIEKVVEFETRKKNTDVTEIKLESDYIKINLDNILPKFTPSRLGLQTYQNGKLMLRVVVFDRRFVWPKKAK